MVEQLAKEIDLSINTIDEQVAELEQDLAILYAKKKALTKAKTCEHKWSVLVSGGQIDTDICNICGYQWHY